MAEEHPVVATSSERRRISGFKRCAVGIAALSLAASAGVVAGTTPSGAATDGIRNGLFTCRAAGVRVLALELVVANGPNDPCADDGEFVLNESETAGPLGVTVRVVTVSTEQNPEDMLTSFPSLNDFARADAETTFVEIVAGGTTITASVLTAHADIRCTGRAAIGFDPGFTTSGHVDEVNIDGVPTIVGSNHLEIPIPVVGTLHLNETIITANSATRRALWLDSLLGDVVVAEAAVGFSGTNPCRQ